MASGHNLPSYTEVMNIVYRSVDDNGDRLGYTSGSFSIPMLEVQVCHSLQSQSRTKHPQIHSFRKATCLFSSDANMASFQGKLSF